MKHHYLAAGALLLGTSALAWAADTDKSPVVDKTAVETKLATDTTWSKTSWDKSLLAESKLEMSQAAKPETASLDKNIEKLAFAETEAKLQTASKTAADSTGMGGPDEVDATTTASLTPRPADQNYPPCDPGPGDDRCIQLYEPGVRAQLASWNRPTGGLADGSATTAMGGPYEPVDDDAKIASDAAVASHAESHGVGGPVEAQSGYPPCSPGPGDDRCIQLYERGVTGAGN